MVTILAIAIGLLASAEARSNMPYGDERQGIKLKALHLPSPNPFDIDLLEPGKALANIGGAIDMIYAQSPFSAKWINKLKHHGRVSIMYDPNFPKPDMASQVIAAYFPDYFQHKGNSKEFLVVVGRFGAKWPKKELAAVIVHELVGHGLQHLRGKTTKDRKIDRECEALIHEEKAYQDFAYPRDTANMVRFRKDMRNKWCGDFSRFMSTEGINTDVAWGYGKPDVPKLLKHFERYTAHLRKTGISARALQATRDQQRDQFESYTKSVLKRSDGEEMFSLAKRYLKGIGTSKDEKKAREWFDLAAEANHPRAQYYLAAMMESGVGGPQDKTNAHMWYSIAVRNGVNKAGERKAFLTPLLSHDELSAAQQQVNSWWSKRTN
jgi:hypothetical protein